MQTYLQQKKTAEDHFSLLIIEFGTLRAPPQGTNRTIIKEIMIIVPETSQGKEMLKSVNWKNNSFNKISKSKS